MGKPPPQAPGGGAQGTPCGPAASAHQQEGGSLCQHPHTQRLQTVFHAYLTLMGSHEVRRTTAHFAGEETEAQDSSTQRPEAWEALFCLFHPGLSPRCPAMPGDARRCRCAVFGGDLLATRPLARTGPPSLMAAGGRETRDPPEVGSPPSAPQQEGKGCSCGPAPASCVAWGWVRVDFTPPHPLYDLCLPGPRQLCVSSAETGCDTE